MNYVFSLPGNDSSATTKNGSNFMKRCFDVYVSQVTLNRTLNNIKYIFAAVKGKAHKYFVRRNTALYIHNVVLS